MMVKRRAPKRKTELSQQCGVTERWEFFYGLTCLVIGVGNELVFNVTSAPTILHSIVRIPAVIRI
jgi:hypothetical protein